MRLFFCTLLSCLALPLFGQFGIAGFYNSNDVSINSSSGATEFPYHHGSELAVNYWFRLNKKRVEFQPTLYYARLRDNSPQQEFGFQFKTNIYPFDFGTDCECPTFGKQGPQLQKGLFLQLSPGVAYHRPDLDRADAPGNRFVPTIGAGVGLDFGVSNLVTLTPLVSVRHTVTPFSDFVLVSDAGDLVDVVDGRLTTLQFGLQATFRLDKRRY